MRRDLPAGLVLSFALALSTGCTSMGSDDGAERARLAQARSRWRAAGITDYRYELRRVCFCPQELVGPFAITVRGGALSSVVYVPTGAAVVPAPERHPTVEGLFGQVEAALDRNPSRIAIDYDSALGYPTRIDVDYVAMAVDDEVTYVATGLARSN
jgi:hypothetical protein